MVWVHDSDIVCSYTPLCVYVCVASIECHLFICYQMMLTEWQSMCSVSCMCDDMCRRVSHRLSWVPLAIQCVEATHVCVWCMLMFFNSASVLMSCRCVPVRGYTCHWRRCAIPLSKTSRGEEVTSILLFACDNANRHFHIAMNVRSSVIRCEYRYPVRVIWRRRHRRSVGRVRYRYHSYCHYPVC